MTVKSAILRAALLGAVSGMRSLLGAALISRHLAAAGISSGHRSAEAVLSSPAAQKALTLLSAGEVVADKLPGIPARTKPGPLIARAVLGGVVGAAASSERRGSPISGAIVGAVSAVAATFAAYHLRRWLTRDAGLPDAVVAVAEDAAAFSIGRYALEMR